MFAERNRYQATSDASVEGGDDARKSCADARIRFRDDGDEIVLRGDECVVGTCGFGADRWESVFGE